MRRHATAVLGLATGLAATLVASGLAAPSATGAARSPVVRCTYQQLRVHAGPSGAATGHIGFPIRFTNVSTRTCSLHGYPGVAGLSKHGTQVQQAKRTKRGFIGGLKPGHKIPTVILKPGRVAAALVEGTDVPTGNHNHCRELHGLLVTPPNDRRSTHLSETPPDCSRIQVHPVVHNKDGNQLG